MSKTVGERKEKRRGEEGGEEEREGEKKLLKDSRREEAEKIRDGDKKTDWCEVMEGGGGGRELEKRKRSDGKERHKKILGLLSEAALKAMLAYFNHSYK